ncbi:MAG: glycosyl transferase [Streptomycetaceae bacterium]|nr:MAG: glycosyl transferase [Streptomycetaceae bacterium]
MNSERLTILFMPESAYGPTNQCIGIGYRLLKLGHRVVFAAEASWEGKLKALGFEEDLVDLAPPAAAGTEQDAGQFWTDYIRDTSPEFRKPTISQLESFMKPTWQALIDGAMYCEPQLKAIIERVKPDVVVEDNVISFPALMTCGKPFVRIVSCNPLEIKGKNVAPAYSGYPAGDRSNWDTFRSHYRSTHGAMWSDFNTWVQAQGAPALSDLEFIHESPDANIYVYPEVADYTDQRPLNSTWTRIDSSVRETDSSYEMPALVLNRAPNSKLIYLSLGSLGSADVSLMKRLIEILGRTEHTFIVSMGPQHEQLHLAPNMVGSHFLPQINIIPQVDLVITHGGNNTVIEALHYGKPMILLPLFWDQYDNAQRMHELGFGIRLATYEFTEEEMGQALDKLLNDNVLATTMKSNAAEIQKRDGLGIAANLIESVARAHKSL